MAIYRRQLPHYHIPEADYFITYGLAGALPYRAVRQLDAEFERRLQPLGNPLVGQARRKKSGMEEAHRRIREDYLDRVRNGPRWLAAADRASVVKDSLHFIEDRQGYWRIWCYCIMPNHVHLVCTLQKSAPPLERILQSHKSFTARMCNRLLGRSGPFWQEESFDRLLRNDADLIAKVEYTLLNPVQAGLVKHWQEWSFSYLCPELQDRMRIE